MAAHPGPVSRWLVIALVIFGGSLSRQVSAFPAHEANVLIQWGSAELMGVGPSATGEFMIPPTPTGVYDEEVIIPIDGDHYLYSSNGYSNIVVVRKNGFNSWFFSGVSPGNRVRYPKPVNFTHTLTGSTINLQTLPILKVELMEEMIAAVVETAPTMATVVTWHFIANPTVFPPPIGRISSGETPDVAISFEFDQPDNVTLVCGGCYCLTANLTNTWYWNDGNPGCPGYTSPTAIDLQGNSLAALAAMPHAFVIFRSDNQWLAYGTNSAYRFGVSEDPSTMRENYPLPAATVAYPPRDAACGSTHCVYVTYEGALASWGDNSNGQCGFSYSNDHLLLVAGVPNEISVPGGFGDVISVGAIGQTSYALTTSGLWAWGVNMDNNFEPSLRRGITKFGFPTYERRSFEPALNYLIPPEVSLHGAPRVTSLNNPYIIAAVQVPAKINVQSFLQLRANHTGLSSRQTPINLASSSLLVWGAGPNTKMVGAVAMGNRSVSSFTSFARHPMIVEMPPGQWKQLAVSERSTFALSGSQDLAAWGLFNSFNAIERTNLPLSGLLPSEVCLASNLPMLIEHPTVKQYLKIASAAEFTCGYYFEGGHHYVDCWGANVDPVQGLTITHDLGTESWSNPILKCGTTHCGFIRGGNTRLVYFWSNTTDIQSMDQLCRTNGEPGDLELMEDGEIPMDAIVLDLALGEAFTIIQTDTGLFGCGYSNQFQLGQSVSSAPTPLLVPGSESYLPLEIAAGRAHVLMLQVGATIISWGANPDGQLGQSQQAGGVIPSLSNVVHVAAVYDTSFAITTNGDVYAWGRNDFMNMFGDPVLMDVGHSAQPLLLGLEAALRIDATFDRIFSSSFAKTVYALASLKSGPPLPSVLPSVPNKLMWFGADFLGVGQTSAAEPKSLFQSSEVPLPTLLPNEYIIDADHLTDASVFITNQNRLFVSGESIGNLAIYSDPASPMAPRTIGFSPLLAFTDTSPASMTKVRLNKLGIIILYSDGALKRIIVPGTFPTIPAIITGTWSDIDCVNDRCAFLTPDGHLHYFKSNETAGDFNEVWSSADVDRFAFAGEAAFQTTQNGIGLLITKGSHMFRCDLDESVINNPSMVVTNVTDPIISPSLHVQSIAAGTQHIIMLMSDGRLYGYGDSTRSQLPNNQNFVTYARPVYSDFFSSKTILKVAATAKTSYIFTTEAIYAFGFVPSALMSPPTALSFNSGYTDLSTTLVGIHEPVRLRFPVPIGGIAGIRSITDVLADIAPFTDANWAWAIPPPAVPSDPPTRPPTIPVPSSPPQFQPQAVACPPPPTSANWTCNTATGQLVLSESLNLVSGQTIEITGSLVIEGDLTIPPGSAIRVVLSSSLLASSSAPDSGPILNITGCATIDEPLGVELDEKAVKELDSGSKGKVVKLVQSSCPQAAGKLLVQAPPSSQKGCRRYTVAQDETKSGSRANLNAILTVTRDTCKQWWIILVSVIGAVAVVTVALIVLLMLTPLKSVIMPYHGTNA